MRYWFERALSALYLKVIWGPRCPDHLDECFLCQKWQEHDDIFWGK